jgi:hypothetical protein
MRESNALVLEFLVMLALSAAQLAAFQALLIGFAFAGLMASAFQLVASEPPSFRMILGKNATAVAAVPLVFMTAPFIIMRNTLRGRRFERRPVPFVALATIIACGWSMLCGLLILRLVENLVH